VLPLAICASGAFPGLNLSLASEVYIVHTCGFLVGDKSTPLLFGLLGRRLIHMHRYLLEQNAKKFMSALKPDCLLVQNRARKRHRLRLD